MSSNVVQFKPISKKPQQPQEVKSVPDEPQAVTGELVMMDVLKSLQFYANQGWDGGQKARSTLLRLSEAFEQQQIADESPQTVA